MTTTVLIPATIRHAIPAYRVVLAAHQAGCEAFVVLQGSGMAGDRLGHRERLYLDAGASVITAPAPLGMGGAIMTGLEHIPEDHHVIQHDADLTPHPEMIEAWSLRLEEGWWLRPSHVGGVGRLSKQIVPIAHALNVPVPDMLCAGGLLSAVAGYPADLRKHLAPAPPGYGWDTEVFLRLLDVEPERLRIVPAPAREHDPGDQRHVKAVLREVLPVLAAWSTW